MNEGRVKRLLAAHLEHIDRARDEYEAADACLMKAIGLKPKIAGTHVSRRDAGGGLVEYEIIDQFATDKFTLFRQARFPRFVAKEIKPPKATKQPKSNPKE